MPRGPIPKINAGVDKPRQPLVSDFEIRSQLNARQQLFAKNIMDGMNISEAYTNAGYRCRVNDPHHIGANAAHLMRNPKVTAYIAQMSKYKHLNSELTLDWWIETNMREATNTTGNHTTPASRAAALDRLGKFLGAYQDNRKRDVDRRSNKELLDQLPKALKVLKGSKKLQGVG